MKNDKNMTMKVILLILFIVLISAESLLNLYISGILWTILCIFGIVVLVDELKRWNRIK